METKLNTKSFVGNLRWNLWSNNEVLIPVLGICSTLGATGKLINTVIIVVAVMLITALSSFFTSLFRRFMPWNVRMIVQVFYMAVFTIIFQLIIQAYMPHVAQDLAVYIPLIITNCILMGRTEGFALQNNPFISFWDGITAGMGYGYILLCIAFVRELLGFGTLFGFRVLPHGFITWNMVVLPLGSFFLIGIANWVVKSIMIAQEEKALNPKPKNSKGVQQGAKS